MSSQACRVIIDERRVPRRITDYSESTRSEVLADDRSTVPTGVDDDVEECSSVEMTLLSGLDIAWIDHK